MEKPRSSTTVNLARFSSHFGLSNPSGHLLLCLLNQQTFQNLSTHALGYFQHQLRCLQCIACNEPIESRSLHGLGLWSEMNLSKASSKLLVLLRKCAMSSKPARTHILVFRWRELVSKYSTNHPSSDKGDSNTAGSKAASTGKWRLPTILV